MDPHQNLSSYLVRPDLTPKRYREWAGFRTRLLDISRANPHIIPRTLMALLIWSGFFASVRYITAQSSFTASTGGSIAMSQPSPLQAAPAALSRALPAQSLPSGATSQPAPLVRLAADRTFANTYAPGQCTWYVASRRPIPSGWGNARSWYYNAMASGWRVGSTPAVGAIAWTSIGWAGLGHVALVEQVSADGKSVYISEMNYRGPYIKSYRWVSATSFKYIY